MNDVQPHAELLQMTTSRMTNRSTVFDTLHLIQISSMAFETLSSANVWNIRDYRSQQTSITGMWFPNKRWRQWGADELWLTLTIWPSTHQIQTKTASHLGSLVQTSTDLLQFDPEIPEVSEAQCVCKHNTGSSRALGSYTFTSYKGNVWPTSHMFVTPLYCFAIS